MIANFLNDKSIQSDFSVSFAYNYSEKYEQGLNLRVSNTAYKKFPLRLMKQFIYQKPLSTSLIVSIAYRTFFAFYMLLYKYLAICVNTAILFRFFTKQKIDILHINNGGYPAAYSCYSSVLAAKMAGVHKIVYVINNLTDDYKHPFRWLDYPIDFFIKKWVTVFITGSENAGERLKKILKLDESKQLTINNGIQKRTITLSKEQFKVKYSILENKFVASVVANLETRKGHIFLLQAILQIKNQYPQSLIPLFIFEGLGPEKKSLEKYVSENELDDFVLMIDYIPDVFNLLNASDVVILPSIASEDFPNIIIEAMSLGKPVIGTNIGGIPEQIENNKTGIVVKPQNSDELKNAIIKLSSDLSVLQQFSVEAQKKFDALYEYSISVNKYHNLYKLILTS
jgi:glycosyltransferase involved in cell wall biosynthesis